jgi:inosine-uridine nucleoside N-ribohydrolase
MTAVRSGSGAGRQPALGAWTERPRAHRAMIAALLLLATALGAQEPPRVIVDTDMLTDCDDAGALAVLHALADLGEVAILGIVLNGIDAHGKHGAVVSAIDTYYHRGDLPIGVSKRPAATTPRKASSYSQEVFAEFPHDGLLDAQRPDAVAVYRRLLAAAPDHRVTIVSIGFLTNLDDLLRSGADALDARDGMALVRAKVAGLSVMGGTYPSGKEYNFSFAGAGAAAHAVIEAWPDAVAPVVFSGFELGGAIITGMRYQQAPASPMRRCYELAYDALVRGRPSWDPTAVLQAVRGLAHDGVTYWTLHEGGSNQLDEQGANAWRAQPMRRHGYLEPHCDHLVLARLLDELMTRPPGAPPPRPAPP